MKVNYKQIYSNYKHTDNRDVFRNFFLAIVFTGIYLFVISSLLVWFAQYHGRL